MTCMTRSLIASLVALAALPAQADLIADSQTRLELRNLYFNRDFRQQGATQSKADEWAQGIRLDWQSGYTPGRAGVGLDAIGLLGIKLDSSQDRSGTGILKRDRSEGRAMDEYGQLGLTAKLRLDEHVLRLGTTLLPQLPVAMHNDTRLLPQSFRGGWLQAKANPALNIDLGRFNAINLRDSSDHQRMGAVQGGARNVTVSGRQDSSAFDFAGLNYQWSTSTRGSYHYGELDGLYRQHYLTLNHGWQVDTDQRLNIDLRYAKSSNSGRSNIDNRMASLALAYHTGMHRFSASHQRMDGKTGFAYIAGTDPFLTHLVQINDFANRDERSWQVRHDYSFSNLGLPGLKLMNRYTHGDNIQLANGRGKEWERNTDLVYVIQSGVLKNLSLHWRNATYRSTFASDMDENRLIVGYTLNL